MAGKGLALLHRRGDETAQLAGRVRALGEAADLCEGRAAEEAVAEARRVVLQTDRRLAVSGAATVVALAGATGSGKSSTFNALTGTDLATVGVRRPTTSTALACSFGQESAEELLDWLAIPRRHALAADQAYAVGLDGLVLLDLPDHDSTEVAHRMEVDRLVQLVDMLVWVVDPQKYADAALHDRYLKPLASHVDVMMVVLNQIDVLSPEQRDLALRDLRRLLASEGLGAADVLGVSARTGEGMDEFRRLLEGAGLLGVEVRGHTGEHRVPDVEALWEGGLGSLAMTAAAIVHQPAEVRARVRAAFERRAAAYRTAHGLTIPVAFLIGSGRRPG